ncbi:hypothetical protein LEP1GSC172_2447 [Leptospira noguchii]|uniref:Uncharacterized protein n=1 Tax=Leptospira noguchii TaxID=28182 RepID=M6VQ83_9LEPT|nr:hypothetical protein LEP1GSC172_2447 [Leptospira noguchii]
MEVSNSAQTTKSDMGLRLDFPLQPQIRMETKAHLNMTILED